MRNYYNELDAKAAAWLRELIAAGHIPDGDVDERSICDVQPGDLAGYVQCHFFAGIGGWPLALKLAGWPEDRKVWTGSCPCQPYSCAGKQLAQADERHLWPSWFRLIQACEPECIISEQVSSAIRHGWLDGVFADLEDARYTCGAAVLGAHSVGSPHTRQRLYWVADATCECSKELGRGTGDISGSAWQRCGGASLDSGAPGGMGNAGQPGLERLAGHGDNRNESGRLNPQQARSAPPSGGASHWSEYDILHCLDGKTRRTQPGLFPLAHGLPAGVVPSGNPSESYVQSTGEARAMRLRGYGNAIVPQVAAEFIQAYLETTSGRHREPLGEQK